MELTRRDALAALAAAGVAGGGAYYVLDDDGSSDDANDVADERLVETAVALSAVLYPSSVTGRSEFVRTYVNGRIEGDEERAAGMRAAAEALDGHAEERFDAPVRSLPQADREELLSELSMDRIRPDPEGSELARVRFYLVNELVYGLLSSPKGGELVGIENPPGHPGGVQSYQEAPGR